MNLPKRGEAIAAIPSVAALVALLFASSAARAQEWTRFRGPNGTGISPAEGIPVEFTASDYNWRVELPGEGHSSPVVWGEKIFLTTAPKDGANRLVLCLETKRGDIVWTKELEGGEYRNHRWSSYASSTPAVDADFVYVSFCKEKTAYLAAFDHSGTRKWNTDLGRFESQHGFGSSPMLYKDLVVIGYEQLERESHVIALDRISGDVRWKTPRPSRRTAYGTPCVYDGESGPELLVTSGANGVCSLDPKTGTVNWGANVFDKRSVSSPTFGAGLVFGTCGSGGGGNYLVAVRAGGKGDVTESHVAYIRRQSIPYVPTSLYKDGRLFLWSDKGVVACIDAATGDEKWRGRVTGAFTGSPIWIQGNLYAMSHEGELFVVSATADEFKIVAQNDVGELSRATPAVASGRLYLRTVSHLISVGGKKEAAAGD